MEDLYNVIEKYDTLRLELLYHFKANKGFIESELADSYLDSKELNSLMDGIEYTQRGLLNRFDKLGLELTEILSKNNTTVAP